MLKKIHTAGVAILELINHPMQLWKVCALIMTYIWFKDAFLWGLHPHQLVVVGFNTGCDYVSKLVSNFPMLEKIV